MKILFTVCGRAGSKGVAGKNTKNLLGIPLVFFTMAVIEMCLKRLADEACVDVCLNTDSDFLADLVTGGCPWVLFIRRRGELAGDVVSKLAVIKNCLLVAEATGAKVYDLVVDLDITSPLRSVDEVIKAIKMKKEQPGVDVVFSVVPARRNPYFNMVQRQEDGSVRKILASDFAARQQAPVLYDMNASIYVYSSGFIRNNTSALLFDGICDVMVMDDPGVLDIDSEADFRIMEVLMAHYVEHDKGFGEIYQRAKELWDRWGRS